MDSAKSPTLASPPASEQTDAVDKCGLRKRQLELSPIVDSRFEALHLRKSVVAGSTERLTDVHLLVDRDLSHRRHLDPPFYVLSTPSRGAC